MNPLPRTIPILLLALLAVGCQSTSKSGRDSHTMRPDVDAVRNADVAMATTPFDDQARRGVEAQRAIFSYHFRPHSAELTSLGRKVVLVLAESLERDGGQVSVQRGGASPDLYAARIIVVRENLRAGGVGIDRIVIDDGMPGGRGTTSRNAVRIQSEMRLNQMQIPDGQMLEPLGGSTEVMR